MALRLWIREEDRSRAEENGLRGDFSFCVYFAGSNEIIEERKKASVLTRASVLTCKTNHTGCLSSIGRAFVLGKVQFWENKGGMKRTPFVRIDGGKAYEHGVIMDPLDAITLRYRQNSKTIDKLTPFKRVQLLGGSGFIGKVFTTYYTDSLVPKPGDFERHLLIYCDDSHLFNGQVG